MVERKLAAAHEAFEPGKRLALTLGTNFCQCIFEGKERQRKLNSFLLVFSILRAICLHKCIHLSSVVIHIVSVFLVV